MPASRLLLLAFLLTSVPAAQERDQSDKTPRGSLTGRVIAADTGRPVARAQVSLAKSPNGGVEFTTTDDAGAFVFKSVQAGRYTVIAAKRGIYLDTHYGRTQPDLPATLVAITPEREARIEIQMLRAAVVAGRVFDEAGDPLPFARVVLTRHQATPGSAEALAHVTVVGRLASIEFSQGNMTDDRGEYRLFGLQPGEYLLHATAPRTGVAPPRFAPIYYPGVTDPGAATVIQLIAGQEIANADLTMRAVPIVKVSGIVLGPEGHPPGGGDLALFSAATMTLSQVGAFRGDGSFSFDALPGEYSLRARYSPVAAAAVGPSSGNMSVAQPITIGNEDISGLVIRLTSGATMTGKISFEGSSRPDPSSFRVTVQSGTFGRVEAATRGPDGTFTLRGIESGQRRLSTTQPAGWVLKSIHVGGRDVSDVPIEFRDDTVIADVSIVFTDLKTPLTMAVEHSDTDMISTVVIFPDDPALWHSRRLRFRAATSDPIVITDLPPGDYLAAAIANVSADSINRDDPKLLERLRPVAQKIQITEGVAMSVRLRALHLQR